MIEVNNIIRGVDSLNLSLMEKMSKIGRYHFKVKGENQAPFCHAPIMLMSSILICIESSNFTAGKQAIQQNESTLTSGHFPF